MNPDDLIAKLAQLRKERAPKYIYDFDGLGHKARTMMLVRTMWENDSQERIDDPIDDELPEGM